jgi:hypothetical protein
MSRSIRLLLALAALGLASSARATDLAYVKCAVNQDRVWVYESLGSFDVEARLRCGSPVEILSRVKGYVRIRTESGVEGFVPDSVFPDLPPLPDDSEKPLASIVTQSAAAPARSSASVAATPAQSLVAAAANPSKPLVSPAKPVPSTAVAPEPRTISTAAAPAPIAVPVSAPARPAPATVSVSTTSARTKPAATPAATAVKKPEAAPSAPSTVHAPTVAPTVPATPARPSVSVETVSESRRDSAAMMPATAQPSAAAEDSDEYPDTQPENESADPACRVFFAAYGLAPSQYKWLAENRRKEFSQICPAPDLAHVDYVVLFTHDSDSYTYAMPTPVHVDHNGFSDFSPMTTVDTALLTSSEVEKARYEFVWVFRVTRGAFDPARFSARRRPQFTTYVKGSRAPSRAVEDAFSFVENQGLDR